MTSPHDSQSLEELFEEAKGDGFTRAETDALWSRVAIAPGAAASGAAPHAASAGVSSAGAGMVKGAVALIGGGLIAAGTAFAVARSHEATRPDLAEPPATVVAPAQPQARTPDLSPTPTPSPIQNASPNPGPTPTPIQTPTPGPNPIAVPVPRSHAPRSAQPSAPPAAETTAPSIGAASSPGRAAAPGALQTGTLDTPSLSAVTQEASPAAAEGALLLRARRLLPTNPATALALTQEHARSYPSGDLVPEREVLAIEALAQLGRDGEARARLAAFRARFPQSPSLSHLEQLVAH